jgi:hypothetical protein
MWRLQRWPPSVSALLTGFTSSPARYPDSGHFFANRGEPDGHVMREVIMKTTRSYFIGDAKTTKNLHGARRYVVAANGEWIKIPSLVKYHYVDAALGQIDPGYQTHWSCANHKHLAGLFEH